MSNAPCDDSVFRRPLKEAPPFETVRCASPRRTEKYLPDMRFPVRAEEPRRDVSKHARVLARPARHVHAAATWLVLAALLVLGTVQCGHKGVLRAPEDCAPKTIGDLSASNVPEGIRLTWSRPKGYVDGSRMEDLGAFVIERSIGPGPFERLSTVAVTDRDRFRKETRFRHLDPAVSPGGRYSYRVVSFTVDEYASAPSNIVSIDRTVTSEDLHAPLPTP